MISNYLIQDFSDILATKMLLYMSSKADILQNHLLKNPVVLNIAEFKRDLSPYVKRHYTSKEWEASLYKVLTSEHILEFWFEEDELNVIFQK